MSKPIFWKNKKNIISLSFSEFSHSIVSVMKVSFLNVINLPFRANSTDEKLRISFFFFF